MSYSKEIIQEVLNEYDYSLSAGPLLTAIQEIPTSDDFKEIASLKIFDLTRYLIPDMIWRCYNQMNYFIFLYGNRGFYKSTLALWLAWQSSIISGFELPKDYSEFIVDDNNSMLELIRQKKPVFYTAIKDERDKKRSGAGNQTLSEILDDQINRIRGRQYNIIICTPEDYDFPVDFKFRTWRFQRKPIEEAHVRFLVEYEGTFVGHVNIKLPPQEMIHTYHSTVKAKFLERTQTLEDPMQGDIKVIIHKLAISPDFPYRMKVEGGLSNIFDRRNKIAEKYPYLTEGLKKEIERELARMEVQGERQVLIPEPVKVKKKKNKE